MHSLLLLFLLLPLSLQISDAKHTYIHVNQKKCFYQHLSKEMLLSGRFKADFAMPQNIRNEMGMKYDLGLELSVIEIFDNNHVVYKQTYNFLADSKENRIYYDLGTDLDSISDIHTFTFTSLDDGEHAVCLHPFIRNFNTRRLVKEGLDDRVKIYLDFERLPLSNIADLVTQNGAKFLLQSKVKVEEIYRRLEAIKADQLMFRNKYVRFHELSAKTHVRTTAWAVAQAVWLGLVCVVQLRFLKQFFRRQKVV